MPRANNAAGSRSSTANPEANNPGQKRLPLRPNGTPVSADVGDGLTPTSNRVSPRANVDGTVRAFALNAPPAKLTFFSPPEAAVPPATSALPRLSDLLRVNDVGLKAVLTDWLQGCYTATQFEDALAQRDGLQPGECIYVKSGHVVTRHSVGFYAQDSEQAGLLARAQEIENLEKQLRAQIMITDEARAALVRAEAAYADASQRLVGVRREATEAQTQAHALQVEALRLTQQAEQARARSAQIDAE